MILCNSARSHHPMLEATEFERNQQTPLHLLIVGAAWSTYLIDNDDVVWRFIKNKGPATRPLEHSIFLMATLLTGLGAYICTVAHLDSRSSSSSQYGNFLHYFGEGLYAIGFASLLPLPGCIILIVGEMIRLGRLALRQLCSPVVSQRRLVEWNWPAAMRLEVLKWGILISMIVFSITLVDRHADLLIAASFLIWMLTAWCFRHEEKELT
jgi:hypothetical protein